MSLEETGGVDPVVERTCEECGAALTEGEMRASLEAGGMYIFSVHAAEQDVVDEAEEPTT